MIGEDDFEVLSRLKMKCVIVWSSQNGHFTLFSLNFDHVDWFKLDHT